MAEADSLRFGSCWSIFDIMEKLDSDRVCGVFAACTRMETTLSGQGDAPVRDDQATIIRDYILGPIKDLAEIMKLRPSVARSVDTIKTHIRTPRPSAEIHGRLNALRQLVQDEMRGHLILYVEESKRPFYENPLSGFGDQVEKAFPSAVFDLTEAGRCYACGLNNATVHHLVSAAEFGLRALAADRRVEIKNRNGNNTPLESSQWGEIIGELQKAIDNKIKNWPASQAKDAALMFYSRSLLDARALNDGHRRHIAHARGAPYSDAETYALMRHVEAFFQRLSTKITETAITPEIWS